MANKKANTLRPPQRLNPQPVTGLLPVKAHVYRTIAELNAGFDKVIADLGNLNRIIFFRSDSLSAMHNTICAIRAQANRELIHVLNQREAANAGHFEGLCLERGGPLFPPEKSPHK